MKKGQSLLIAAGEVCVNRDHPESIFDLANPFFPEAGLKFFQLEVVYSKRGVPSPEPHIPRAHPRNISALKALGFGVASFASNHTADFGEEGVLDTLRHLRRNGIKPAGAGKNLDEAHKPVFVEHNGNRVAFLAYCSILPRDFWATSNRAGCCPLKIATLYESQLPSHPGNVPRVRTFPDAQDLRLMLEDVRQAKSAADVVAVSFHAGVHTPPHVLPEYQVEIARMMIDAGADVILGTGVHQLKPIEVYKGKVIFHSLGNFAFDLGRKTGFDLALMPKEVLGFDGLEEWGDSYAFPPRSRTAMVAKCTISAGKVSKVSFVPLVINKFSQPRLLTRTDRQFREILEYVAELCREAKIATKFSPRGDEVVVETGVTGARL